MSCRCVLSNEYSFPIFQGILGRTRSCQEDNAFGSLEKLLFLFSFFIASYCAYHPNKLNLQGGRNWPGGGGGGSGHYHPHFLYQHKIIINNFETALQLNKENRIVDIPLHCMTI